MDREKIEQGLQQFTHAYLGIENTIANLNLQRELFKQWMLECLVQLGIDRFEDSRGNLLILKRWEGGEPWHVMYVPIESRLKQNPKLKIA